MKKKLQVFVSSTYKDMLEERQAAVEAILKSGHIPAGMELFTAGDASQLKIIKKWIEDSDIFVLILGGRYGTLEPKTKKSYIELEYRYAQKIKKPYLAIVIKENVLREKKNEFREERNMLQYKKFRKYILSKSSHFYEDAKDIQVSILHNINAISQNTNLSGWVSGKEAQENEKLLREIIELRKSKDDMQNRLNKMIQVVGTSDKKYEGYSYIQIKQFLKSKTVIIKNIKTNIFDLFISFSDHFNIGVGNSHSNSKLDVSLFWEAIPTLLNYGLAEKLSVPASVHWGHAHTSKLGHKFIAESNNKISRALSDKYKNLRKTIEKMISEDERMKKIGTNLVRRKSSEIQTSDSARTRIDRILSIMKLKYAGTDLLLGDIKISQPKGHFSLYSVSGKNKYYAIAIHDYKFSVDSDLADIRVMIENWREQKEQFEFVIVTNDSLKAEKNKIEKVFGKMLDQRTVKRFRLSIWDNKKILNLEKRYHLR